jgi:hypothetical protein
VASSQSIKPRKLTESGLARELGGVSRQAVHELVKRGILSKDKDGLIDVEMAKIALLNRVRPSGKTTTSLTEAAATEAATPTTPAEPDENAEITSYHIAKTLREAAEAQIARLKLAEMRGELIRVDAVKTALAHAYSATRDALLQIPARLAPLLAADAEPASVQNSLYSEIHQALQHLAGASERIGQTDATA